MFAFVSTILSILLLSTPVALYEQGKALREEGKQVEAMQAFIEAAHSGTDDEALLGRVWSNMANMCRQANDHQTAFEVYTLSAEHFRKAADTLAYAYALNNILTSAAVKKNDPLTVTMYTLLFSFLFLIPFSGLNSLTGLCLTNPMILVVAFLMCLVTAVFAQYFFSVGLGLIESGKAAIYGATEPIVGSLVGIFIFHEESNLMKIIGIIMVIAAILIIGKSDAEKGEEN